MQSGTGTVIGVPELVDVVVPLPLAELAANVSKAGFPKNERISRLPYPRTLGWVLQRPHHLKQPVPYADPYGAVIWVISACRRTRRSSTIGRTSCQPILTS